VLELRRQKAMLIEPQNRDPDSFSVGSFFVNPIVTSTKLKKIQKATSLLPPNYPSPERKNNVKLSAAWLIEQAGFKKGHVFRHVGLSTKHALAIINRGGGNCVQIMELSRRIQSAVEEKFGIKLLPEPVWVGDFDRPST
jgi:UDP-N-acetylmuramate dehydrogenase